MNPSSHHRASRGGAWTGLVVGILLGLLAAGGALAILLYFVNGVVSTGLEGYLKKYVFDRPEASFGTVRADVFHGRFVMTDLKLKGEHWSVSVPEVQADLPPKELLSGNGLIRFLRFASPLIEGDFSLRGGYGAKVTPRLPPWLSRLPIAEVRVMEGHLRLRNRDSDAVWGLRKIEGKIIHPVLEEEGGNYRFQGEGWNEAEEAGQVALDLTLDQWAPTLNLTGEWTFRKWPMESLVRLVSSTSDVQVTSGQLDLKTQLICKKDWLTASHLVDISDFKVEVSPRRKQLLGIPVKQFKEMMTIPAISFVVPMNGSIHDPHVGFASSVQQILYNILEGKVKDKQELEKISQRGGSYFGAKIDAALRSEFKRQ